MNLGLWKQIHGLLWKMDYSGNLFLSSSLINLYGKFGCREGVDFVFDHKGRRNSVVWTAKIVNNCREEHFDEVLDGFREMGSEGVKKNGFTFSSVLRACGRMEDDGQCGRQVHANEIKLGLESNDFVRGGLVDMYAKRGLLKNARTVFEVIGGDKRTAACWNAMLTVYIQHEHCIEAIKFFIG
ncbi:Pentatricopeptide repeat-containing protein [Actinidia chinensis var. chinensis]|uniref:Pentatricopeptide repeat-containing protein n=1 Tax=Actinidia chinensis var. chinensis TaxID=1590841 RepID=A0A2R6PHL1_ACTCC|nr:Pentatricopeptide repeat-containing protein [Actinidia chinensis var. chinensis]